MFVCRFRISQLLYALAFCLCSTSLFSQNFIGTSVEVQHPKISQRFTEWEVFRLDASAISTFARNEGEENEALFLHLGQHHFGIQLQYNDILSPNYRLSYQTESAEYDLPFTVRPYRGYNIASNEKVRLTLDSDLIYGFITENGEKINIQPLWYIDPSFAKDLYIVYPSDAVITDGLDMGCGTDHSHLEEEIDQKVNEKIQADNSAACYQVDLAIASDASMLSKYGSPGAVQAHNIAVLNDVEGDYTGNFNHDIQFNVVIHIVSASNPWGASPEAGTYLSNFRTWGNGGGFGVPYDLAELWTNIDLNGPTIGVAYLSAVCTSNRYHVLQDFSSNAELLRCLVSHEIGHNFSANHDNCPTGGTVFIMCPFVSTSTTWSAASTSSISSFITSRINNGCISPCGGGVAPIPGFSWNPDPACVNQAISFTDESTGTINTRSWTFPGGTPATSTLPSPTVTWSTPGVKNVTLILNNGTGVQASLSKQVTILGAPTASFTSSVNGLTVTFNTTAANVTSFEWDFGDGGTSTDEDPIYTYAEGGTYFVKLTATGPCGTVVKTTVINTAPTAGFTPSVTTGCTPLAVSFTNNSSSNATSFVWQFPGGTPTASNQANPIVVYQIPGVYSVTLTAFNSVGSAVATSQNLVTAISAPISNFTFTISGNTVNFTGISPNGTGFLWNFGDGATSTLQNPTHTYATGGSYAVTFTTTNICGSTPNTKTVVLATPPVAAFTATPTTGCGPLTVEFSNTSSNATGVQWSFPGGSPATSTANNVTVTYDSPGTFTASLTASNIAGPNTATQQITVLTVPNSGFTNSINGATVSFNNTTSNGNSYFWNFGDGTNSTLNSPSHTYLNDGTYQVVLSSLNGCGTSTAIQTITITTPPTANFNATATSGCTPLTVQFNNTSSSNATNLSWQFPGGSPSTSTLANPMVTYSTAGQYTVILVASNSAGSSTSTQTNLITANTIPITSFTNTTNGYQVNFTNTSTGATTYNWAFGNGSTSILENPTFIYPSVGTYTVTLTTGNACGSSTSTQTVNIVESPTAAFTATPTAGCNNLTVQFNSTSAGNPATLVWQFPGGNPASSTNANPSVTYNSPGAYTVILTATNSAGSGSVTQTNYINVGTAPNSGFTAATAANVSTFSNASIGATAYSWDFGDNTTSTLANPTHTYSNDGVYTVTLTASNSCGTNTSTQVVTIVTPPTAGFTVSNGNGCVPLMVTYNNASSANATSFNWQFAGGTPSSSTAQNPTVTYANTGTYSAILTVSNSAGTSSTTQTNVITAGTVPSAGFIINQNGASASFSNTSNGATTYNWNFGDGGTANTINPNHIYSNDGTYTVTLTATNNCGNTTSTQTIVVTTPPIANFTATGSNGCAPTTVTFNNTSSSNASSFSWLFPGGTPASSSATNPVVEYSTPGEYSVILTASNAVGNSTVTQTNLVVVGGAPTAGFQLSSNNNEVLFTNTSSVNATAYSWNFGDGNTSTDISPSHTYLNDGNYTVVLTTSNSCGSATFTQTVEIITPPTAGFIANNTTGCAALSVQFSNTSSANATTFAWLFPGGIPDTSSSPNPTIVYPQGGSFTVTLTATNAAGSATVMQENVVIVSTTPTPLFTYQTGGLSAQFTNASFNANSYTWNFGDGGSSTAINPVHNYTVPGTYIVTLQATNICGTEIYTQTISITGSAPIAQFTAGEQTTGCAPFTVQFTDQSIGQPSAWAWTFVGGTPSTSTLQNPVVVYNSPGVYSASLQVTNLFGNNSSAQNDLITVNTTPLANFGANVLANGTVQFNNTTQNGISYQWNFGDGTPASTEISPSHTYSQSGTYTVSLSAINGCGVSVYQTNVIVDVVGVQDHAWINRFQLFPNPNHGVFTLDMEVAQKASQLSFEMISPIGQLIRRDISDISTRTLVKTFDYGNLPAGIYSFRISNSESAFVIKVTVVE